MFFAFLERPAKVPFLSFPGIDGSSNTTVSKQTERVLPLEPMVKSGFFISDVIVPGEKKYKSVSRYAIGYDAR